MKACLEEEKKGLQVRAAGCCYTALAPGSIPVIFLLHPQSAFGSHLTALNLRAEQQIYLALLSG